MAAAVKIFQHFDTPKQPGIYHRLICLTGEDKGKAYFLMGKRIVMGRSETCDVTVLDLKSSREHAELINVGGSFILTDLGSQNGIVVNDLKVKQHSLNDGDKIIIGKTVFKFSKVEVAQEEKKKKPTVTSKKAVQNFDDDDDDDEYEEEEEPKNKRLTMILSVLGVLAIVLMISDDSGEKTFTKPKAIQANVKEIDKIFSQAAKERVQKAKKDKEKLQIYFRKGLREFREKNYFRAISEFENARQWSPNDPLANFYLRKTREALDEQIESYFSKAIRDIDALNYRKAVVNYCSVLRLLVDYKTDPRYLSAMEGVANMEKKMGLDEGEIQCIEVRKDGDR